MMRRRQIRTARRKFSGGVCVFVGLVILMLIAIFSHSRQKHFESSFIQKYRRSNNLAVGYNVTEEMVGPFSVSRQLNDQIALAKALIAVAKEHNNLQFAWELSAQIRIFQLLLSNSATNQPPSAFHAEVETAIRDMSLLIHQAKQLHYDSATTIMKLKAQIQDYKEQISSLSDKNTKSGQQAAEAVPKGLYCLGVMLTMDWFRNSNLQRKNMEKRRIAEKLNDNNLYHFCIFSDNLLGTSVVINSTSINAHHPELLVFHVVTDQVNYAAMKAWFSLNSFRGVTVDVQKLEDLTWLNASYVPVLKQLQDSETQMYYFSGKANVKTQIKFQNPKYLSMLNHLRFYIPEFLPQLKKVVFLDDDVVVQKDLIPLFKIDLHGNVNGAVETCMETFHRFHTYLNFSHPLIKAHFDPDACGWAFGMNVFDLVEWRRRNVTGIYHYWQERNVDRTLWKLGTLPPGLLSFYGLTEVLSPEWHMLGLGYDESKDLKAFRDGAVVHYNGNRKPWMKIAIEKYKGLWEKYVDYSHPLLQQCNVH
ncbi:probable galacturonosyltransferase 10 [Nymphaea colorata]|nr:probable galacturonosyltransferase 10 [Nymphaea colorata]